METLLMCFGTWSLIVILLLLEIRMYKQMVSLVEALIRERRKDGTQPQLNDTTLREIEKSIPHLSETFFLAHGILNKELLGVKAMLEDIKNSIEAVSVKVEESQKNVIVKVENNYKGEGK